MEEKKDSGAGIVFLTMLIIGLILAVIGLTCYVIELKKENAKLSDETTSNTKNTVITPVYDEEEEKEIEAFSDAEAKECLQNYLNLVGAMHGSTDGLLNVLGYTDYKDSSLPDYFQKTTIKYSDFKNKMLNYMTEGYFNNSTGLNEYFDESDEYLAYKDVGASGWAFEVESVQLVEGLKYSAIVKYGEEKQNEKTIEFSLENVNGKLVISACEFDFFVG